jgi:hypothetical protein
MPNIEDILKRKNNYIDSSIAKVDAQLAKAQTELLNLMIDEIASQFQLGPNNVILNTPKNIRLLSEIDKIYADFTKTFINNITSGYASSFTKLTNFNKEYFAGMGFKEATLNKTFESSKSIQQSIGIKQVGNKATVIKGGYLEGVTEAGEVRNKLKQYTLNAINSKTDLRDYTKGVRKLVNEAGEEAGILQRYWGQYVFDTSNIADRAESLFVAEQLKLRCFIYSGQRAIKSSRPFCQGGYDKIAEETFKPKIGKVFIVDEFRKDYQDMDFQGRNPAGDILHTLGGYHCRHDPMFISDKEAIRRDPTIKERLEKLDKK